MKSYMEIIGIKNGPTETMFFCKVEMIPVSESIKKEYVTKQIKMVYVPLDKFNMVTSHVEVGQVFVVLHNLGRVYRVCEEDIEATANRKALKKKQNEAIKAMTY